jgi:hypothetical protein
MKLITQISLFLVFIVLNFSLNAQAGKLEGSALRLKFSGVSGFYLSDWEKRNQDFNLVYSRVFESNWQDQNRATGTRVGADYYAALKDPLFTHILFGAAISDLKGSFPTARASDVRVEALNYKGYTRQTEFTFGVVISVFQEFRVIPKFVHRSIDQSLNTNKTILIAEGSDFAFIRGKEEYRGRDSSGYFGLALEYDLTPNLSFYFDSLLFNNVLFLSSGKYSVSGSAEGYLVSGGRVGVSNRIDDSTGNYKISGNRFSIGSSLKISDSIRLFVSAERDTIFTQISSPFGTNLVIASLLTSRTVTATTDTINKTLAENLMYTQKQKFESSLIQIGISKDINL